MSTTASRAGLAAPDLSTRTLTTSGDGRRRRHQGSVRHPRDTAVKRTLYVIAGVGGTLVFGVPLIWSILRAFQSEAVITQAADPATFFQLGWQNFAAVFSPSSHLLTGVVNSLVVSIATAVLTAVIATMAGYGFARFRFRGSGIVFGLVLLTMMVPFQAILTPLYLEMNAMKLTNSLVGLVLFYTTVNLPFGVFVMRNAFESIPTELEDSAFVDGASDLARCSAAQSVRGCPLRAAQGPTSHGAARPSPCEVARSVLRYEQARSGQPRTGRRSSHRAATGRRHPD
ncbi:carbohydrate ABC transporter permease [Curtobacterium sp. NPDC098951]|uniref:carbohydrate ABC transporter permease n=1 Tax=Curtobacterium sp. NPDC098951 TaxID=3363974 RepID=UPI003822AFD4